jgi:hypothetical protein
MIVSEVTRFFDSGGKNSPQEYIDYILMTELWHCTPADFFNQEESMIELHTKIYNSKNRYEWKKQKREEQKNNRK